ncbi:MAG: hypothetical protein JRG95_21520 [Deltaproteobacteria bacterium]|nr:hypothetical protein [Deltaproteobacteria bacterium]
MPGELLTTIAECGIGFAGFSALVVIIPQLAGTPWRGQMATGLWLMVSWSLTAFVFSLLPLVVREFGASESEAFAISSGSLGIAIIVQGVLAGSRDRKLARAGAARPAERRIVVAAGFAISVSLMLFLNSAGVLPGSRSGWYLAGLLSLFVLAAAPLSLFLEQLDANRDRATVQDDEADD